MENEPEAKQSRSKVEMTEEQKAEYVFANCICTSGPSWIECCEKSGLLPCRCK